MDWIRPVRKTKHFMGDIDQNQFQPNDTNNEHRALQGNNVATRSEAVPNGEALTRHHLLTYTDDEKKWLVKTADEERSKGKGFMLRLKRKWDQQYPDKNQVSKQNLRDNAVRFKIELETINYKEVTQEISVDEQERESQQEKVPTSSKWTNEMKMNLLKIEERERKRGRGFMKRIKEAWDTIYEEMPMSAQKLRDNAARFKKDKSLLNLIEIRDGTDVEPEQRHEQNFDTPRDEEENAEIEERNEEDNQGENENTDEVEDEDTGLMRLRFEEILNALTASTKESIVERDRLMKLKKGVAKAEIDRANKILKKHLINTEDMCKVVDAVYAMGRTIEERKGIKRNKQKSIKKKDQEGNRRVRKLEKQIKEMRQIIAWSSNEIHRRKIKRKATKKEKSILQELREWADQQLNRNEDLVLVKEKALDELRYRKVNLIRMKIRDARIRNNRMFKEDEGMFYRNSQGTSEKKGKIPKIEKFEDFWAGIWEDNTKTPHRKWMNTVSQKIMNKVTNVKEFTITEKKLYEAVKKRKNWSAPGIDGIQNFWWKKLRGAWDSLTKCYKRLTEHPDDMPSWLTQGRTVLLPKTEDLSNERNYRPITCLNTCYKIFTGMIGSYMKEHADRNNIWDRSQMGTCSGVLGTVDQLIIDNNIMDEVRNQQRNLAVAFYDYQKAYDMVRHDWMLRVYKWMGVPAKVVNVINKLMEGWKTRLELTHKGKVITSRMINIVRGFLQGDSYSPVGFCLTEVPVAMLMEETDGYMMGPTRDRQVKRTHSLFIDDLKTYQENHQRLEIVNEMIVKASMDTGACYGVKKCAEIVFRRGKMIKGEGLTVLEEKMEALDPDKNEVYKFLGCEQADKIDVKRVMERVKKEIRKRLDHLTGQHLNDENLMKAINCRVIPVAGYVMNV